MDNRVFYKMLLEVNSYDDLPVKNGDYEISSEGKTIIFSFKDEEKYTLEEEDLRWIIREFEEYLRPSDIIAFKLNFHFKDGDFTCFEIKNIDFLIKKETDIFSCYVQVGYYDCLFFQVNLTDEQIAKFKADRIAFSDYLRSEVM